MPAVLVTSGLLHLARTVSTSSLPGLLELVDALLLEHREHVVVVDADGGRAGRRPACGVVGAAGDLVAVDLAVVGEGLQGLLGHRVDGVGDDEVGDVHRVGVARVLDAGRRPQRPLGVGAGLARAPRQRSLAKTSSYAA